MHETKVPWSARQGDVCIERLDNAVDTSVFKEIPREDGGVVLAHGEVTGHKHQFRDPGVCQLRNETMRIVKVDAVSLLQHEEHVPPIEVAGGQYEVLQQCQWDWTIEGARPVVD